MIGACGGVIGRTEGALVKKNHGFTLVELMIVMAIAGILAVAAVPVYTNLSEKSRFRSTVDDAFETLRYARQLAMSKEVVSSKIERIEGDEGDSLSGWVVRKIYKDSSGASQSEVVREFHFYDRYSSSSPDNIAMKTSLTNFEFNQLGIVKDKVTRRVYFCYPADTNENRVIEIFGSGSIEMKREGNSCD